MNICEPTPAPGGTYLVTGAAGHLGTALLHRLCDRNATVYALLMPQQTEPMQHPNLHYFYGDVCELGSLRPIFAAAQCPELVVIHTAALISIARKAPPKLWDVNVIGTRNVLALCKQYGVRRLVHVSSVHAIPELPRGQVMREVDAFSPELVRGGYARTKAAAAQSVLDAAADGLDAVVVLPSGILGPYNSGSNHLTQMVRDFAAGRLPACVPGGYDFVDVRDVAKGCLLAAEKGRAGECYLLTGHYSSIPHLLELVSQRCGRKMVPVLPMALARAAVPAIELHASLHSARPLYTGYSLEVLRSNSRFCCDKAQDELGYAPRPLPDTVRDMVLWLRSEA